MSKVSAVGVKGDKVIFKIGERFYQTGKITAADSGSLTVKQAQSLIDSGDAVVASSSYLAQFPWTMP